MFTARTIVSALRQAGVREVVIAPGSRSAPLVYALAEVAGDGTDDHGSTGSSGGTDVTGAQLRLHVRIDERSAAFTALGLSLGTGRPAAVLTTSGTAAGNLLPAVMEASHADARLVAITADRPAELQGTGANQTTDQVNLYGTHVRRAATVSGDDVSTTQLHTEVLDALRAGSGSPQSAPGPVHLNVRFREPLVPEPDDVRPTEAAATGPTPIVAAAVGSEAEPAPSSGNDGHEPAHEWDPRWSTQGSSLSEELFLNATELPERRTVVVAGHNAGPIAAEFASALGLPLFAEPSSNARFGTNAIAAYPLLLGPDGGVGDEAHPLGDHIQHVVIFGRPTLSRQLSALLNRQDLTTLLYHPRPVGWFEEGRRAERPVAELGQLARLAGQGAPGWLAGWQAASMRGQAALEKALTRRQDQVGRPGAMRVAQLLASTTMGHLVLGSSSVIRDVDIAWRPPTTPHSTVFAHRGLAGIDGTVSTAAGIALSTGVRTALLCGDLTFLYDTNGLWQSPEEEAPDLDIVVINDQGGAIFAGLEHGDVARRQGMAPTVERFFGTPHQVNLEALCAAHGITYRRLRSEYEVVAALGDPAEGRRVLEVVSDRQARPEVRAAMAGSVRATFR